MSNDYTLGGVTFKHPFLAKVVPGVATDADGVYCVCLTDHRGTIEEMRTIRMTVEEAEAVANGLIAMAHRCWEMQRGYLIVAEEKAT